MEGIVFSNPGGEICILVEKQVQELKVCIRDYGIGIKEEDKLLINIYPLFPVHWWERIP